MIQPNNDPFTPSEVRTYIEEFRREQRIFGERLNTVCEDVASLRVDVRDIRLRLITVEDAIRIDIPNLRSRVTALESSK